MVAGMGSLMDLCPPPEEWTILSWCKAFGGVLPSRLEPEDWHWLKAAYEKDWLTGWYERWHEVAKGHGSMPQSVVQHLVALSKEAEEKWQTSDSGS